MKIIIDISEEDYEYIKEIGDGNYQVTMDLYNAVYKGKVIKEQKHESDTK